MKLDRIDALFVHHPPHGDQAQRYAEIRATAHAFASLVQGLCPESREKSLAITAIRQAMMWASAAIAIHEPAPASVTVPVTGVAGAATVTPLPEPPAAPISSTSVLSDAERAALNLPAAKAPGDPGMSTGDAPVDAPAVQP